MTALDRDIDVARQHVEIAVRQLRRLLLVAVSRRDGTLCHYCQVPTILTRDGHPRRRTLDHVIPQALGGTDEMENLVLCCSSCNSRKGVRRVQQFAKVETR
jgi:5-methylcytosine-specific restriction endonuclease McrA